MKIVPAFNGFTWKLIPAITEKIEENCNERQQNGIYALNYTIRESKQSNR